MSRNGLLTTVDVMWVFISEMNLLRLELNV